MLLGGRCDAAGPFVPSAGDDGRWARLGGAGIVVTMNTKLPLGSIVVGVDGSAHSVDAVAWAVAQATRDHRPLVIAHATGRPTPVLGGPVDTPASRQTRRIAGRRHVDAALKVAKQTAPDLRVETLVGATSAWRMLLGLADQAHLVVVGSRGLGPIGSVALRSVSVAVASGANAPVVVVRTPGYLAQTARIVIGTDGTSASTDALEFGFAQASSRRVPLTVAHCTSEVLGVRNGEVRPTELPYNEEVSLRLAEALAGLQEKYVDVTADVKIARGSAAEYLIRASSAADLVVVGARGHHGPGASFLGSVSQTVVERAHCSVAVVHRRREVPEPGTSGPAHSARSEED
jgi:nucleotide-binding universal stress UspA family protein